MPDTSGSKGMAGKRSGKIAEELQGYGCRDYAFDTDELGRFSRDNEPAGKGKIVIWDDEYYNAVGF